MQRTNSFIVLEGADGTGKSTAARNLATILGAKCIATPPAEFGGIREIVDQEVSVGVRFLYYLTGVLHASDVARQSIIQQPVVCDRYLASTIAYHRAMGLDWDLPLAQVPILQPDFSFLLLVDEDVRKERIRKRGAVTSADVQFQDERLRHALDAQYGKFEFIRIDTSRLSPDEVVQNMLSHIGR